MGKFKIDLDLDSVKLDKLHEDAIIKDTIKITKATSSDVTNNYNVSGPNQYGGISSSSTETMDLSSVSVSETNNTNTSINANPSDIVSAEGTNTSAISDINSASTNTNINLNSSSNTSNGLNNGNNIDVSNSNNNINASSATDKLGMENMSLDSHTSKDNEGINMREQKNKPSLGGDSTASSSTGSTSSAIGINVNGNQDNGQDSGIGSFDASFDMPEDAVPINHEEASINGGIVTLTSVDAEGKEVKMEVSIDEYTDLLESFGLSMEDINRVLNSEITLEELTAEIDSEQDNTRRKNMQYAYYLQTLGLEYTDINDLASEIKNDKSKLDELYKKRINVDNHEIDAVANFIARLQMGEALEDIVTSSIVAWEYTDENGNVNYRYDDPYASGYVGETVYTPLTFEDMYKDSKILEELKENLTEQTYKPLFAPEEKTVHVWNGTAEQQEFFDDLLEKYHNIADSREADTSKLDAEIKELEEKVNVYDSIYKELTEQVEYYFETTDKYLHKEDFDAKNDFNNDALQTISDLQEEYKNVRMNNDLSVPPAYVTDKDKIVDLINCMINGEGNVSNGYLQVGNLMLKLSSDDYILENYLKYLPYISYEEKDVFNYIYNTEGKDAAYEYLNGELYDNLDKRWVEAKTGEDQEFASEHPVLASAGSVVVTPFEGISAFCYSMNAYFSKQKIRMTGTYSAGDVWRSTVAQNIAEDHEILSFLYSTGMSMADSLVLIGLTAATGGALGAVTGGAVAAGSAASTALTGTISAVTMGSRAYVSTLNEALGRGLSDGQSVLLALTSSVVETVMESKSVSHLLNLEEKLGVGVEKLTAIAAKINDERIANVVSKGLYIGASAVSQALVEGEEEFSTEVVNYLADIVIAKDTSNFTKSIEHYVYDEGCDDHTALMCTLKDFAAQTFQAFAGGFVSGICFGAFGGIRTVQRSSYAIANDMYNNLTGTTKAQKFAQVLEINRNQLNEFYELAKKKQSGETLTPLEEHFLRHGTVEMQIAQNMKDARDAKLRGIVKTIREMTQTKGANNGRPVDVATIDNFSAAAKDFAEGNKVLEKLLLTSHKYNIDTIACCGGHIGYTQMDPNSKYYHPYIAFKMTEQFERCLPTILETLGNTDYDVVFIKNPIDSGASSFVLFNQTNYSYDMFTTLNTIIENVMGNDAYITNVSENTNKMMELYNYLKSNELTESVQFEISRTINGTKSETSYEYYHGSTCGKDTFATEELASKIAEAQTSLESLELASKSDEMAKAVDVQEEQVSSVTGEKLTLKEFKDFTTKMEEFIAKSEEILNENNISEEEIIEQYFDMQTELLSHDLSDIPFEAWQGVTIFSDENHPVDFSKTHANIDFEFLDLSYDASHFNFQGCNIKNIQNFMGDFNRREFDGSTFSREIMEQNPDYFLLGDFSEEFKERFYKLVSIGTAKSFHIADLTTLTDEQLEELMSKQTREYFIDNRDRAVAEALGLKRTIELYEYSSDVYNIIQEYIANRGYTFGIYNLYNQANYDDDVAYLISGLQNCTNAEDFKRTTYDFLKKAITKNYCLIDLAKLPADFVKANPDFFLTDASIPDSVRQDYYSRNLKIEDILKYREVFENVDLEYFISSSQFEKYIVNNGVEQLDNDLITRLDSFIEKSIKKYGIKYGPLKDTIFKNNHPELFLADSVPEDIQTEFYNRRLTLDDFDNNPALLNVLGNINVSYGLSWKWSALDRTWLASIFEGRTSLEDNIFRLKILKTYSNINKASTQRAFYDFLQEHVDEVPVERLDYIAPLLNKISESNSSELRRLVDNLVPQILLSDNPLSDFDKIERIFVKNNIPTIAKIYLCFKTLYANYKNLDFSVYSIISPVLKSKSARGRDTTIFSDLIRISMGSNNSSMRAYLDNIETAYDLYSQIKDNTLEFESLDSASVEELRTFRNHLQTLYSQTLKGRVGNNPFNSTGDIIADIDTLKTLLAPNNGNTDYYLPDRVVSMFCHFAGFDTLESAKNYLNTKVAEANERNMKRAESTLVLEPGDLIKAFDLKNLGDILGSGVVAREFLGSKADSDWTPLDTDLFIIEKTGENIQETIQEFGAENFGQTIMVLKNRDQYNLTRGSESGENLENYDENKLELFYTKKVGPNHVGIRTGFASTDIDYILTKEYKPIMGFEIARNGFYIPVVNMDGEVVFTPDDYNRIRAQMQGLSHYNTSEYTLSSRVVTPEVVEIAENSAQNISEVTHKYEKIYSRLQEALDIFKQETGIELHFKTDINGDLSEGSVELFNTGSTGRFTNKPGDGDFDFMLRVDNSIFSDDALRNKFKAAFRKAFKIDYNGIIDGGDIRAKGIVIDDVIVDVDVTFVSKTDRITYSTDISLRDRLDNIKKQYPEQYKYVLANIALAKQVLKEGKIYKPNRGETPQGGLGGVGVENWILQHGGSFIDAVESFLEAAKGKDFVAFNKVYKIWDFGENLTAEIKHVDIHDEFIANNMGSNPRTGFQCRYNDMVAVLERYIKGYYQSGDSIESKLYRAINTDEGIDEIISEINSYTEENMPEGYSSLTEFKERLATVLTITDTLDKLNSQQFYDLIKDPVFLRKVVDSNRLNKFIKANITYDARKIMNLLDGVSNEELVQIFDRADIKEFLDTLSSKQLLEIYNAIARKENSLLIVSENIRNKFLELDAKTFTEFVSKNCGPLGAILKKNETEGTKFLDKVKEIYGKEEVILANPLLARRIGFAIPSNNDVYAPYKEFFRELNENIKHKVCENLVTNAEVDIPETGIIQGKGFFKIKYSIDGIEYEKSTTEQFGRLNLLNEFDHEYNEILAGKLKIISVEEDTIRNNLVIRDSSKTGLNVVTLEINGKEEKYLVNFNRYDHKASLENLLQEKQIDTVKVVSVEPFVKTTFNINNAVTDSVYKMTYVQNGKVYEHYFLPYVSGNLNIDSYIISNNLYDATDINLETIKISDISKEKGKITNYLHSEELFNEESYGGNQSDVRDIVVKALSSEELSNIDLQKSEILIDLVKKYYPNATDTDIKNIVSTYAVNGCAYMATANAFVAYMNSLENGASIFRDKMGFDLAVTDGNNKSLNVEAVALDYFLYTHKFGKSCDNVEALLDNASGTSADNYGESVVSYFKAKNVGIQYGRSDLYGADLANFREEFLVDTLNKNGFFMIGSSGFNLEALGDMVLDKTDGALASAQIKGNIAEDIGGHQMLVTDVLENGDLIVSSWKGKYRYIVTKNTTKLNIYNINFLVNDTSTNLVENELVKAINSKTGVDDVILKIIGYTEENMPEGYSSLTELKERLAETLIETGTLDKLENYEFAALIGDKTFLRKVLDSEKLNYLIRKNLDKVPRNIVKLLDGLSSEEIVKVFDNDSIRNYVNNLTDEQFLSIAKEIFSADSNILISSSVLTDRLLQMDTQAFVELLKGDRGSISDILEKNPTNGVSFVEKLMNVFGTEEVAMKYPLLPRAIAARVPYDEAGIYHSYNNKLEELQTFADNYLASKLKENSETTIPSNGIIDKEGYFVIKYSIDGKEYEYRNSARASSSGLNLVDNFKDEYWQDIIDGKFKIMSVAEDTISNNLYIGNVEQEGLNVVTVEIDGKIEKHILDVYRDCDDLIEKYHDKDIKSAKIVSIEPFITSSYDFEAKSALDTYIMHYKIDGQEYSHYLLPGGSGNTVYVNNYIIDNNLYNISDVVIEPASLSVSDAKSLVDIKKYHNSSDVFSDQVYGGRQGSVREIVTKALDGENLTGIEKQKSELLISLIKKYYPDATDTDIKNIANYYSTSGCGYMAIANAFVTYMNSLENGTKIFKDKMGFDLAVMDGNNKSFNFEAIALDYYLYVNKISRGYDTIRDLYVNPTGMDSTFKYVVGYYFKSKGIDVVANIYGTDYEQYKQKFLAEAVNNPNAFIILGSNAFALEKLDSSIIDTSDGALAKAETKGEIETNIEGHDMLITDIDENGDLIVSSWSGKHRYIPDAKTKSIEFSTIEFKIADANIDSSTTVERINAATDSSGIKKGLDEVLEMVKKRDPYSGLIFEEMIRGTDFNDGDIIAIIYRIITTARQNRIDIGVSDAKFKELLDYIKGDEKLLSKVLGFTDGIEVVDMNKDIEATLRIMPIQTLLDIITNDYSYENFLQLDTHPDIFDGFTQEEIADGINKLLNAAEKNNYDLGLSDSEIARAKEIVNAYGYDIVSFVKENVYKYRELINNKVLTPEVFIEDYKFNRLISEQTFKMVENNPELLEELKALREDALYFAKLAIIDNVDVGEKNIEKFLAFIMSDYKLDKMSEKVIDSVAKNLIKYLNSNGYSEYRNYLSRLGGKPHWLDVSETRLFVQSKDFKDSIIKFIDNIVSGVISREELIKRFDDTTIEIGTLNDLHTKYNEVGIRTNWKGFSDGERIVVAVDDGEGKQTCIHEMLHALSTFIDSKGFKKSGVMDYSLFLDVNRGINEAMTELFAKAFSKFKGLTTGTSGYDEGVDALIDMLRVELVDSYTLMKAYFTNDINVIKEHIKEEHPKLDDKMWNDLVMALYHITGHGLDSSRPFNDQKEEANSIINNIIQELLC